MPVLTGLALVLGGIELGAPGTPPAQAAPAARYWAPGELPEYPGGLEYPLGEGVAVNGIPLRISYFEAKANASSVRDFYVDELERRDLVTSVRPGVDNGWTVAALSEDGRHEILIAIMGRGHNRSLVFPSIVPLGATPEEVDLSADLALTQKSVGLMRVSSADRPGESMLSYQEPDETAGQAAARIRDEMGKRGWTLARFASPVGTGRSWTVEAHREGRRVRHTLSDWGGGQPGAAVSVEISGVQEGENHVAP